MDENVPRRKPRAGVLAVCIRDTYDAHCLRREDGKIGRIQHLQGRSLAVRVESNGEHAAKETSMTSDVQDHFPFRAIGKVSRGQARRFIRCWCSFDLCYEKNLLVYP